MGIPQRIPSQRQYGRICPLLTSNPTWTNPDYVATVAGVLAIGALVFYSSLTESGLTVDDVLFVGLGIAFLLIIAYGVARWWS